MEQIATILMNYTRNEQAAPTPEPTPDPARRRGQYPGGLFSVTGNTRPLAEHIADALSADLCEIVPETPCPSADPYPTAYNAYVKQAKSEHKAAARPVLTGTVPDMARYDVVLLGCPNWWSSITMPVCTF